MSVQLFDGVASIALGDVMLTLWQTPARRERVRRVGSWAEELVRRTPGTIAACQFLLPSASPPDAGGRAEARAALRVVLPSARRLVTVPLGDAMWQSVVRGIIRVAVRLSGRSALIKVAANEREAFESLAQVATPRSPGLPELEAGLESLFDALGAAPLAVRSRAR